MRKEFAHVISMDDYRFNNAAPMLRRLGFEVHRVRPVPIDDPEVLDWERRLRRRTDPKTGSPRSAISLSLTHIRLWRSFPSLDEWLWVFEDDVMLDPKGGRQKLLLPQGTRKGPRLWSWPKGTAESAARAVIDEAVAVAATPDYCGAPMLFLGEGRYHHHNSPVVRLGWNHTVRACDALCLHAYGVRRSAARRVLEAVFRKRDTEGESSHALYRYNLDVMLRGLFMQQWSRPQNVSCARAELRQSGEAKSRAQRSRLSEPEQTRKKHGALVASSTAQPPLLESGHSTFGMRPLCVDTETMGMLVQNSSLGSNVAHAPRGALTWR